MEDQVVVAYDQDFDGGEGCCGEESCCMESMNAFEALGAKRSFFAGLVLSVLTLLSVGCIIFLVLLFAGRLISA